MSVLKKPNKRMDKEDDDDVGTISSPDERRVAPIRVVNLASLQDIKVVSKEMPAVRPSRRKSVHQVRSNSDDQIEFIESRVEVSNDTSGPDSPVASVSNPVTTTRRSLPIHPVPNTSNSKRTSTNKPSSSGRIGKEPRPNADLMKRVALLRVCAEYMLNELQVKNVVFGENQSLEMLKAQYMRNTRRQQ